jgi:membrane associated rhomboid family serine protease
MVFEHLDWQRRRAGSIALALQAVVMILAFVECALLSMGSTFHSKFGIAYSQTIFCLLAGSLLVGLLGLFVDSRRSAATVSIAATVPIFVVIVSLLGQN